ncbi:MAG: response regulator [Bacteroidetes bacterium]|nr:response regulator [Bacteroidota bacterium]
MVNPPLSLSNWSLQKALDTQPDNYIKARIRIIYAIIFFSLVKASVVLIVATSQGQSLHAIRAGIGLLLYGIMLKYLLYKPSAIKPLAHVMTLAGLVVIWTNIFVYTHAINLVTVQFIFMILLSSFYTLNSLFGVIYSVIAILPVIIFLAVGGAANISFLPAAGQLASPGYEIMVILNFLTITICHYLFFDAFNVNLKEKEKLNAQLKISIDEANRLAATRANFLSTMSHELRTPLNSVIGITELLIDDNPDKKHKDNLKILQLSANDLLSLINNILDFNKIDSDMLVLEKVPVNISNYIQDTCEVLKIKATDKQLDFVLDIDNELKNINIITDPTRLSQLLYNLVGNAIKFTEQGGITIRLNCLNKTPDKATIKFCIEDTGIGINPDKHEAIFELFTQADAHTSRKYGGTGLGLSIVKQILSLFDSVLTLESKPGIGTTFCFTISFDYTIAETPKQLANNTKSAKFDHLKILIAEDNDVNRFLIKTQLDKHNITTVAVQNGKQAYEACLSNDFDAIFMDLHMPEMDGYEALRNIRAITDDKKSGVYIVAFTASVTEQEEIFKNGFNDYLYKPVNMNEVYAKLEKIAEHITQATLQ